MVRYYSRITFLVGIYHMKFNLINVKFKRKTEEVGRA